MKCLIIEDQRPAQRLLTKYINDTPHLELIGVCGTAIDAISILQNCDVDLIFLDLHLPKLDGFDFLRSLHSPPNIIVTTAYSDYALEGFELNVVDYLLKPFSFERFLSAVSKIKVNTQHLPPQPNFQRSDDSAIIFVKVNNEIHRIILDEIMFIHSDGDFVNLVTDKVTHYITSTLSSWSEQLNSHQFIQVHKSYIVNTHRISKISNNQITINDVKVPVGRIYKKQLIESLKLS